MKRLTEIKVGETFKIADIEFVKFGEENGNTIAVAKDVVFHSKFGNNNNFFHIIRVYRALKLIAEGTFD